MHDILTISDLLKLASYLAIYQYCITGIMYHDTLCCVLCVEKGQLLKCFLQHEYESAHAEDEQLASVHLQCKHANTAKPEPIMLLSIIPSRSSQKFYPLFFQIPTLIFPMLLYII